MTDKEILIDIQDTDLFRKLSELGPVVRNRGRVWTDVEKKNIVYFFPRCLKKELASVLKCSVDTLRRAHQLFVEEERLKKEAKHGN